MFRFYFLMCIFYAVLAGVWLYMSIRYYRDILRVQYWIGKYIVFSEIFQIYLKPFKNKWNSGVVIIFGMVEKAVFYSEYQGMNQTGESTDGLIQVIVIHSRFFFIFSLFVLIWNHGRTVSLRRSFWKCIKNAFSSPKSSLALRGRWPECWSSLFLLDTEWSSRGWERHCRRYLIIL